MKPHKTLIFITLVLAVVFAFKFLYSTVDTKNLKTEIEAEYKREKFRILDSLAQEINKTYSLDSLMFFYKELALVNRTYFEYDTSLGSHPLEIFYYHLLYTSKNKAASDNFIRILHYGDSQIEKDRITKTLRRYLQTAFSGRACGFLPLFSESNAAFMPINKSSSFIIKSMRKEKRRGNYGINTSYLAPPVVNALKSVREVGRANIDIKINSYLRMDTMPYLRFEALVHEDMTKNDIVLSVNSEKVKGDIEEVAAIGIKKYIWELSKPPKNISLSVKLAKNRNIYALSINDARGISVENIPIRGSLGNVFINNNRRFLTENISLLNVGLIIYQFGINAVPVNQREVVKDYTFYENMIYQELNYIKYLYPEVGIIVIGTSDRLRNIDGVYETNPNIFKVRDAQKKAALKAGCVFWDLFEAMGGENSMYGWVNSKPALGARDNIHFTNLGADIVGKMLYKTLIYDYREFLLKEKNMQLRYLNANRREE